MTKKLTFPKRQGDINAIILREFLGGNCPEYDVFQQNPTNGPWYEGTVFYPSTSKNRLSLGIIDGHSFVMKYRVDGNGVSSEEIVGVVCKDQDIKERTYNMALDYCKNLAKDINGKFIDKTNRLEKLVK